ncbi:MAG: GNAT family N-acetyltransferase [Chloroflexia bacterium]|nr:GNAT family N-acetyltransferase [Chloroflexia bacterium]
MSQETRFCPRCGHELELREQSGRLRPVCPACSLVLYHNPVPGVAVIVQMEEGILLVRRREPPQAGGWCFPAGFVEADESIEMAAVRECREETGLEAKVLDLVGVYSFGEEDPAGGGIVTFYSADVVGGRLQAGDDAADVRVFPPDDMPRLAFRTHREALARWQRDRHRQPQTPEIDGLLEPLPGVRIRRARPQDEERVLELLWLIPGDPDVSTLDRRAVAQRFRESPGLEVLVAEVNGSVIGFLSLSFPYSLTGMRALIEELAVEPTYRRQGIGAALVEAAVRLARRRDCPYLLVDTARSNEPVRTFYQACGFPAGGIAPLRIG